MSDQHLTAQVKGLSTKAFEAFTKGRLQDIASFTAPNFSFIDARGVQMSAASCQRSLLELISNPSPEGDSLRVHSFKTDHEQERVFGNTVVQTLLYSDQVTFRNKLEPAHDSHRTFRVTNVWVNEGGKVQLVSMHITPVQI
jgi:hypothetical protein